jgi:hypothetical protein
MNHYQILGVRDSANPLEIEAAYKSLSTSGIELSDEEKFEISFAYQTLMNPSLRHEHDAELGKSTLPSQLQIMRADAVPGHSITINNYYTNQQPALHTDQQLLLWFGAGAMGFIVLVMMIVLA